MTRLTAPLKTDVEPYPPTKKQVRRLTSSIALDCVLGVINGLAIQFVLIGLGLALSKGGSGAGGFLVYLLLSSTIACGYLWRRYGRLGISAALTSIAVWCLILLMAVLWVY